MNVISREIGGACCTSGGCIGGRTGGWNGLGGDPPKVDDFLRLQRRYVDYTTFLIDHTEHLLNLYYP